VAQVSSYAGFRYPERPRSLVWRGRQYVVAKVLSEWRTPDAHCFRVRCEDEACFEVRYTCESGAWSLLALKPAESEHPA